MNILNFVLVMKQNTFNKTNYFLADVPSVVYCTSCIVNNVLKVASADYVNVFSSGRTFPRVAGGGWRISGSGWRVRGSG